MNQLIKTTSSLTANEIEAINKVNPLALPFVEAKNSIKFQLIEPADAIKYLFDLMNELINLSGENKKYHLDSDTTKNVAKLLFNELCTRYKGITSLEVRKAFTMGVMGEFGDYVGYGLATFSKFIKSYMESEKRIAAMKEWLKHQDEPATTNKPITEFLKQNTEILNNFFDLITPELAKRIDTLYTFNDVIYHLPSIYDFIRKTYIIEFTPQTKDKIIQDAKLSYYNYIKKSGLKKHRQEDYKIVVQSVKDYSKDELMRIIDTYDKSGINIIYDYHVKSEALKVVLLGIKAKGKRPDNLKKLENI